MSKSAATSSPSLTRRFPANSSRNSGDSSDERISPAHCTPFDLPSLTRDRSDERISPPISGVVLNTDYTSVFVSLSPVIPAPTCSSGGLRLLEVTTLLPPICHSSGEQRLVDLAYGFVFWTIWIIVSNWFSIQILNRFSILVLNWFSIHILNKFRFLFQLIKQTDYCFQQIIVMNWYRFWTGPNM